MSVPRLQHVSSSEWLDLGLNAGVEGGTLWTAGTGRSSHNTSIGDPTQDSQTVVFDNTHGVVRIKHGTRGRPIIWSGTLRLSDASLATVRSSRDAWRLKVGRFLFVDDDDAEYDDCEIVSFEIGAKTSVQGWGADIVWVVPYTIVLEQMLV